MHTLQFIGTPSCRRYQKMRHRAIESADTLGIAYRVEEINDTTRLSKYNPLSLPRLMVDGKLLASKNPPEVEEIRAWLKEEIG